MLKRQRASSPSPLTQATAMEPPLLSTDPTSSEHGAKRRRILAPPLYGPSRGLDSLPVLLDDEADEDDVMDDFAPNLWTSAGKRGTQDASQYKAVNSLLHDLHAEQQHRRLMSPSLHSSSSSPGPFPYHGWSPSTPRPSPTEKLSLPSHSSPNFAEDVGLFEKYRQGVHASEAMSGLCCADDVNAYDWYEETNRLVWFPLDISQSLITAFPPGSWVRSF